VINNLRCADDVVLIATSPEDLQELIDRVRASSEKVGLLINTDKTKVMTCGNNGVNTRSVSVEVLEEVESFVYLEFWAQFSPVMAAVLRKLGRGWQWEDRQCRHYHQYGKANLYNHKSQAAKSIVLVISNLWE